MNGKSEEFGTLLSDNAKNIDVLEKLIESSAVNGLFTWQISGVREG